jgi:sulfopropanediol 3-dehydrogenase
MSFVLKEAVGTPAGRASDPAVVDTVASVIAEVRADGDDAVRK